MSTAPKVLAFAGSTRTDSYNKKLVKVAAAGAEKAGAEVTFVDLRHYPMPLFDEDLEAAQGMPEPAQRFKELLLSHQGFLIAAAEYNSGVTGVLKNAIDWASRKGPGPLVASPYVDKCAGLVCASPGALGGLRVLPMLRSILTNLDVLVIPAQVAVPRAHEAFNPDGTLKDPARQAAAEAVGAKLTHLLRKIHG